MSPFDFLNSINDTKKDLFDDPQAEKDYNSNEMNRIFDIAKKWQFDFLKNSIIKKKRFSKWYKKEVPTDLVKLLVNHYKYSERKVYEIMDILTPEQIEEIRLQYDTGGRS